jgi:hypothetical protein
MAETVTLISLSITYPSSVLYDVNSNNPNKNVLDVPTVTPFELYAKRNGATTTANNITHTISRLTHSPPLLEALS